MTDVEEIEANLSLYQTQLEQVASALSSDPSSGELISLKHDLSEIITLTESQLLELKREELLSRLSEGEVEEEVALDSYVGSKCSILYTSPWGTTQQHNCIILSVERPGDVTSASDDVTTAKLLFLTPSSLAMLPCKHFLNSNCNYSHCKYSHGHSVPISELCEYEAPNYDLFGTGGRCLCRNGEGLWLPGTVSSLNTEKVFVKLDGSGADVELGYDDVFPLASTESGDGEDLAPDTLTPLPDTLTPLIPPTNTTHFGGWEQHTNSFGSKMLLKMGYRPGTGLGPCGEGILNPIEADIIPPGVSLDHIKQLREKRLIRTVYKLNTILQKKQLHKSKTSLIKKNKASSMFSMIDDVLNKTHDQKKQTGSKKPITKVTEKKPITKVTEKTVRAKSVTIENDILRCRQKLSALHQSLGRNKGDKGHCSHVEGRIKAEAKRLEQLLHQQQSVENELKYRSDKRKLKIF